MERHEAAQPASTEGRAAGRARQQAGLSALAGQVGTLAGDNTVLVLFGDEPSLERWRGRLLDLQTAVRGGTDGNGRR